MLHQIYSQKIQKAIHLAITTHEVHEKQKRKGKDIAYITHPLTVGLMLSQAVASEEVVIAGVLHDTIEDSSGENKVTREIIEGMFGPEVAELVESLTETDKGLSWAERKRIALEHIAHFSEGSGLVKSADILANASELVMDYEEVGEKVFERFNAPKIEILQNQLRAIAALVKRWPESPLTSELCDLAYKLQMMGAHVFMPAAPALSMEYRDYDENAVLTCSVCAWQGSAKESGCIETDNAVLDVSCPICGKMLLVAGW